ncbi:hypothetical protein [Desulfococcus sp.]|uniref:hypothetical protein n=1 Tax=Desulfococcus sp. TaxID=2025834 RepID=UPI0035946D64
MPSIISGSPGFVVESFVIGDESGADLVLSGHGGHKGGKISLSGNFQGAELYYNG